MRQPQPEAVKPKINVESELLKHGMKDSPPLPTYNPVQVPPYQSIEHTSVDQMCIRDRCFLVTLQTNLVQCVVHCLIRCQIISYIGSAAIILPSISSNTAIKKK